MGEDEQRDRCGRDIWVIQSGFGGGVGGYSGIDSLTVVCSGEIWNELSNYAYTYQKSLSVCPQVFHLHPQSKFNN